MKQWFNTRMYVAFGLCGVMLSLLLGAGYLGLIPDRTANLRQSRAALAEVVAISATAFITSGDTRALRAMLGLIAERNPDLESVAVRRDDGTLVVRLGAVAEPTEHEAAPVSVERHVKVPILAADRRWGTLELGFRASAPPGLAGVLSHPWVQLFGTMFGLGFVAFYLYLGRVLRQLDPTQAVPARVRSALDTLAEGLIVCDRRGHIVLANSAFAAVLGVAAERLVGKRVRELGWRDVQGGALIEEEQPWRSALTRAQTVTNVLLGLTDGAGRTRTFIVNCAPILGASRPNGVLVSLDDVTQLEEKKAELARARDDAEAANRAKSAFLANMSHEIRTPMNAILGFTELLRRGHGMADPDARKHLATIHTSGRHLLALINDILDLSKVESGHLEVERIDCEPARVVLETVEALSVRAQEKGIGLVFEPLGDLPRMLRTDPARLRQIVTNLVGNAIKFTDRGEVRVTMQLLRDAPTASLSIAVRDTGIGIGPDKLGAIFDPFVQADVSVSRRFGGTGLGLSISRRFARALGGEIDVTSVPGEGSIFTLALPVGPIDELELVEAALVGCVAESAAAPDEVRWRFRDRRVLVVDDGPENRQLVRLVLEECGIVVDEAEDGAAGVEKALAGGYDAVLMDIQMPRLDGLAATRLLRERGARLPVIALTAHAMKGFEAQMREAGYDHWLLKPLDIDAMLAMLAGILGGERVATVASMAPRPQEALEQPVPAGRRGGPPILSSYAHRTRLHAAVRKFVERLPAQIVAMQAAAEAGEYAVLGNLAHGLKGAGGTVGYDDFTEPAIALEQAALARDAAGVGVQLELIADLAARVVIPGDAPAAAVAAA